MLQKDWKLNGLFFLLKISIQEELKTTKPSPRKAGKHVDIPLEVLNLFFTKGMISNIFAYTNTSIQPVLYQFYEKLCNSYKYPHFLSFDRTYIETFLGILYHEQQLEKT